MLQVWFDPGLVVNSITSIENVIDGIQSFRLKIYCYLLGFLSTVDFSEHD